MRGRSFSKTTKGALIVASVRASRVTRRREVEAVSRTSNESSLLRTETLEPAENLRRALLVPGDPGKYIRQFNMTITDHSYLGLLRAAVTLCSISIFVGACSGEVDQQAPQEEAPLDAAAVLAMAVDSAGGREALANLGGTTLKSERYFYIMDQGPEPGRGLMERPLTTTNVSRDYNSPKIRLETTSLFKARDETFEETASTVVVIGDTGFSHNEGFLRLLVNADRPLSPDELAGIKKTERLLNPHAILKELAADPSRASISDAAGVQGRRFSSDEVFPVTTDRVRQAGARSLIVTEEWQQKNEGTPFYNIMVHETTVDDGWLDRWHSATDIDESAHHRLVVADDIHPITLFVNKETGRIGKLSTMEWDVTYGDVALDVNYDDWQLVDGVNVPHRLRLSFGGAPRIDITRSEVVVNPVLDADAFAPPADTAYVHNEAVAERGGRLSQTLLMFGFAGVGRPTIEEVEIRPGMHLLFASPIDGVYTFVVEQENSVVVMEPGMNDLKGEEIIAWIGDRYPGKPISHLIVSHSHNDHAAGMRPYLAAGATLVAHEAAVETYRKHATRPRSTVLQDALDRNPREAEIVGVPADQPFRIEDSTNLDRTASHWTSWHPSIRSGYRSRTPCVVGTKSSIHMLRSSSMMGCGDSPSPYLMRFWMSLSSNLTCSATWPWTFTNLVT